MCGYMGVGAEEFVSEMGVGGLPKGTGIARCVGGGDCACVCVHQRVWADLQCIDGVGMWPNTAHTTLDPHAHSTILSS